jgi:hypothetical protein
MTGLSSIAPDLEGKRLELLREVNPRLSHVAVLWNPANAFHVEGDAGGGPGAGHQGAGAVRADRRAVHRRLRGHRARTARWARRATYVDKILRGARAGDLPVAQPSRFELIVNLRTARALRLTILPTVPVRAAQIIE